MNSVLIKMKEKSIFGSDFTVNTDLSYVQFVRHVNRERIVKKPSIGITETFIPVEEIKAIHKA